MNLKKKTIFAFTVKFVFSLTYLHAQVTADSVKLKPISFLPPPTNLSVVKPQNQPAQLPGNFYAKQLPFFCDKELKIQKAVGFPIKVRVGSVDYVDKLEGKNR